MNASLGTSPPSSSLFDRFVLYAGVGLTLISFLCVLLLSFPFESTLSSIRASSFDGSPGLFAFLRLLVHTAIITFLLSWFWFVYAVMWVKDPAVFRKMLHYLVMNVLITMANVYLGYQYILPNLD